MASRGMVVRAMTTPSSTAAVEPVTLSPCPTAPGVSLLTLNNPPVHVLSRGTLAAVCDALGRARDDEGVGALVLTSSGPSVFSAGLDIREFHRPQPEALKSYIRSVSTLFQALYMFPKPVIAAIGGAAPAGGCWLALQADYRILIDSPRAVMGLNETQLGIVAPLNFREPMAAAVGRRQAERLLQLGALVPPREAVHLGLVDELKPTGQEVLDAAIATAAHWAAIPAFARMQTKAEMRKPLADASKAMEEEDAERFVSQALRPDVQARVAAYLASLKKK